MVFSFAKVAAVFQPVSNLPGIAWLEFDSVLSWPGRKFHIELHGEGLRDHPDLFKDKIDEEFRPQKISESVIDLGCSSFKILIVAHLAHVFS